MAESDLAEGPGPGWKAQSAGTEKLRQCLPLGGSVGPAPQENTDWKTASISVFCRNFSSKLLCGLIVMTQRAMIHAFPV